jgi:hypothetical protein
MFDALKEKDGHADMTKLIVANILNNNDFIEFMPKIKIELRIYINVLYQDREHTIQNIQKEILYTTVERLT